MTERNIFKREGSIFPGGRNTQSVFFGKFFGIRGKQADNSAFQRNIIAAFGIFTVFHTVNPPAEDFIRDCLAVIDRNRYKGGFLPRIFKNNRVLLI